MRVPTSQPPEPACVRNRGVGDAESPASGCWPETISSRPLLDPQACEAQGDHRPVPPLVSKAPQLCRALAVWWGGVRGRCMWKPKVHCVLRCSPPLFLFFPSGLLLNPEFTDWLGSPSEDPFVSTPEELR